MVYLIIATLLVMFLLMPQRIFWAFLFGIGGMTSLFAMIASIIHFQIMNALGFLFLMVFFGSVGSAISAPIMRSSIFRKRPRL